MRMTLLPKWICFCCLVLSAAGCSPLRSGVVVTTEPPPLLHFREFMPRVFVESPETGKQVRIDKLGGPFFVIGFVEPPDGDPGYLSPVLVRMADKLWLDSVLVVQITLPTKACPLDEKQRQGAPDTLAETHNNFARYYDPNKLAWEAYWRPAPGTILLVNRRSLIPVIAKRSTPENPQRILDLAYELQEKWETEMRDEMQQ